MDTSKEDGKINHRGLSVFVNWLIFTTSVCYLVVWLYGVRLYEFTHPTMILMVGFALCAFTSVVTFYSTTHMNSKLVDVATLLVAAFICNLTLFLPEMYGLAISFLFFSLLILRRSNNWLGYFIIAITAFSIAEYSSYERLYGEISIDAVEAVIATNLNESFYFLWANLSKKAVLSCLFITGIIWRTDKHLDSERTCHLLLHWGVIATGISLGLILALPPLHKRATTVKKAFAKVQLRNEMASMPLQYFGEIHQSSTNDTDVVFILGESSSRWHWSLYGYPGNTNPRLKAVRKDLLLFTDAISVHSHTIPVLMNMMYREIPSDASTDIAAPSISLFSLLKKAGVKGKWFSAQPRFAPESLFDMTRVGEDGGSSSLTRDERNAANIFQYWNLADKGPRLLVWQLHASHWPYLKLIPTSFATSVSGMTLGTPFFGNSHDFSPDVRSYDSAIRFTDTVIANAIEVAKAKTKPTVVFFLPDHGEAPEEGSGHNMAMHSARHIEIPFLIYFNSAARKKHKNQYSALQKNQNKPFLNSYVFELIADLLSIDAPSILNEKLSIANNQYFCPSRIVNPKTDKESPIFYDELGRNDAKDVLERVRLNMKDIQSKPLLYQKIYAHRVDSIGKALEAKQYFAGIELDIVYDKDEGRFYVYHPPAKRHGLLLEDLVRATVDKPQLKFWLDWKNSTPDTTTAAFRELNRLDSLYTLLPRVILEIGPTASHPSISKISKAGWRTSYYVPTDFKDCLKTGGEGACYDEAEQILGAARQMKAKCLSFDIRVWPTLKKYVLSRDASFKLLTWDESLSTDSQIFLNKIHDPSAFDVLIVPYSSRFNY
ncbi:phosphoethanolamine transferase [Geomonas agri]|uniref:phosphoethanolamine transferase n=1 Tax=Geomonas agri TaxID=2873702 RepID=UPI001CD3C062|nr:phosphoethanolamine transferase [Geomonas agri]